MEQQSMSKILIIGVSLNQCFKLVKTIIPYHRDLNKKIFEEVKEKLQKKQLGNMLDNLLTVETKYYTASIKVFCYTYNDILEDDEEDSIKSSIDQLQSSLQNVDAIYFLNRIKNEKKIDGLKQYAQLADMFLQVFNPQLQTVVYDVSDENLINDDLIEKETRNIESFIEPVFEDIQGFSNKDEVIKAKPKSIHEDTSGITRIIEAMESTMWTGYQPKTIQKKTQEEKLKECEDDCIQENSNNEQKQIEKRVSISEQQQLDVQKIQEQIQAEKKENITENQEQNAPAQQLNSEENEIAAKKIEIEKQSEQQNDQNKEDQSQVNSQTEKKQECEKTKKQNEKQKQKQKKNKEEDDELNENDMTNFVAILNQMQHMRQNGTNMTDEERKNQASNIMMQFIKECQLSDDEDCNYED